MLRVHPYNEVWVHVKLTNDRRSDGQGTRVMKRQQKAVVDRGEKLEVCWRCLTHTLNRLTSVVLGCQGGDYFVEIACEELKHTRLPILSIEDGVELTLFNCVSDCVLKH